MRFTDYFLHRPILAMVVNIILLLAGAAAIFGLPVREYPKLESATINVTTSFPGATQEIMQGFVTIPLSQSIATANGIEYISSSSSQGRSQIKAKLALNADDNRAMTEVLAKVQQVRFRLPAGTTDPVVSKVTDGSSAVQYVAFMSENMSVPMMTDFASRVAEPLITAVPGVASAVVTGGQPIAMRIWVDPYRLAARGLSASDLKMALLNNNVQSAPGRLEGSSTLIDITASTDLRNVDDFRQMVVKSNGGGIVKLSDIATVELGAQNYETSALTNGKRSVTIAVYPTPDGNPLEIVENVKALIPQIQKTAPADMEVINQFDVRHFVDAAISEVTKTLVEAIIIVIVVIFLFLGSFRAVLIPIVTIPLSLIGTAALMYLFGFSINLLTLLAMVLAIGLVVDDAIVIVENIHRHLKKGKSAFHAALIGAREIIAPVIAMTITLAAVYAPIGLTGGITGALFREFAFTLAGSVVVSGIIALTLSPMMSASLLQEKEGGRFSEAVDRTMTNLAKGYGKWTDRILKERLSVCIAGIAIILAIAVLFAESKRELAPTEDHGYIFALTKAPQYANLDYSAKYAREVDQVFRDLPEYVSSWFDNGIDGQNIGFGGVVLKEWDERDRDAIEIQTEINAKSMGVTGIFAAIFQPPALPGSGGGLPVQMVIRSSADFDELFETLETIKGTAWGSGLFAFVDSDLAFNSPAANISIDRTKANQLGVKMEDIADTLAVLVGENYINRFNWRNRSYDVIVQTPKNQRLTPDNIGDFYVKSETGRLIQLSSLVTINIKPQANRLRQFNQMNSGTVSAVLAPGVTMGQAVAFLENQKLPVGTNIDWLSNSRQYVKEGDQLTISFGLALIVIFLVLAAQFESLRDPFVILVTVPLATCGALLPIYLGFTTLNIYTQIGLVTLIGLISKHGILMVTFANQLQRSEGLDRVEAIKKSAMVRMRPVLMTTAAMVAGLVPLLLASGAGASSRFAIGIVVVTGMVIGTVFTLFLLPTVYSMVAGDHRPKPKADLEPSLDIREVEYA